MVAAVRATKADWKYDAVSIAIPECCGHGRPIIEPRHVGSGWVGSDFKKDRLAGQQLSMTQMQALGSYQDGRMFLAAVILSAGDVVFRPAQGGAIRTVPGSERQCLDLSAQESGT